MAQASDICLTPQPVVAAVLRLWPSGPDLDPCAHPRQLMPARRKIMPPQDGLVDNWSAGAARTVWVNPPYSRGQVSRWVRKAAEFSDRMELLMLVRQDTGTGWAKDARRLGASFCFATSRYHFDDWLGVGQSAMWSSMYLFFGPNAASHRRFAEAFATEGILAPCQEIGSWVYEDPMNKIHPQPQASPHAIIQAWTRSGVAEVLEQHYADQPLTDILGIHEDELAGNDLPFPVIDAIVDITGRELAWALRNMPMSEQAAPVLDAKFERPAKGDKAEKPVKPATGKKQAAPKPKKLAPPAPRLPGVDGGDDESVAGQAQRDAAVFAAVKDIGSKTGEGVARSDLLEAVGIGENALRRSLERLLDRNQVVRKGERRWARYFIA